MHLAALMLVFFFFFIEMNTHIYTACMKNLRVFSEAFSAYAGFPHGDETVGEYRHGAFKTLLFRNTGNLSHLNEKRHKIRTAQTALNTIV